MKFIVLICFLIALVSTAAADPACNKNAWVKLSPSSKTASSVYGHFDITSGKGSGDISVEALRLAFADCFFENTNCNVDKNGGQFECQARNEWQSTAWIGTGNIEFDCNNKLYHCYDVKWDRA